MELHLSLVIFSLMIGVSLQHLNSPPGIPPRQQQHHHQAPSGQQQQQQQQYQGQPPAQQGQAHDDNLRFQGQGGHGHGHGHAPGFGTQDVHNAEHIKEHLKEVVDKPKEEMSDEELEFHYFKLHDYDSNNKLDGIEITKAITHFHEDDNDEKKKDEQRKVFSDSELSNIVDLVMKEDDFNNDGYIEYHEFVTAQRKNRAEEEEEDRKKREGKTP